MKHPLDAVFLTLHVTPRVGVWIETLIYASDTVQERSLPAWECGLKLQAINGNGNAIGHSPRGSVD